MQIYSVVPIQNTANKAMHEVPLLAHMPSLLSYYCSLHTTYIIHISVIIYHFCYISSTMTVPQDIYSTLTFPYSAQCHSQTLGLRLPRSLQLDPIIIDEVRTLEWVSKLVSLTRLLCLEVHKHMVLLKYLRFISW